MPAQRLWHQQEQQHPQGPQIHASASQYMPAQTIRKQTWLHHKILLMLLTRLKLSPSSSPSSRQGIPLSPNLAPSHRPCPHQGQPHHQPTGTPSMQTPAGRGSHLSTWCQQQAGALHLQGPLTPHTPLWVMWRLGRDLPSTTGMTQGDQGVTHHCPCSPGRAGGHPRMDTQGRSGTALGCHPGATTSTRSRGMVTGGTPSMSPSGQLTGTGTHWVILTWLDPCRGALGAPAAATGGPPEAHLAMRTAAVAAAGTLIWKEAGAGGEAEGMRAAEGGAEGTTQTEACQAGAGGTT